MLIDAHCHVHLPEWGRIKTQNGAPFNKCVFEKTAPKHLLDAPCAKKVDKFVVFPLPFINDVAIETANYGIFDLARKYTNFFPFVVIDNKAEHWIEQGCFGFKEHPYGQRIQKNEQGDFCSEEFFDSYAVLQKYGWPLWLHCGKNIEERLLESLLPAFPDLRLVLCHMSDPMIGGFNIQQTVERLERMHALVDDKNVYYDISAMQVEQDKDFLSQTLAIVGAGKCIFGSDFPYSNPEQILQILDKINLTDTERELIFYKNFEKIMSKVFKAKGVKETI